MNFVITEHHGVLVARPESRRLDAAQATSFKTQMAAAVDGEHPNIVLDLSHVDFVDSSGLSAIISTLKLLDENRTLSLAGVSGPVLSLFQLTRFDKILAIYPELSAALDDLSAIPT